jgi:DNA-binding transcriptional MerR regulator
MARDATVRTVLTANDQASGPVKQFQATLAGLKETTGGTNDAMAMLTGGIAGIAAAAGVDAIAQLGAQIFDLGRAAEQAGLVKDSFDDLAAGVGQSGDAMLGAMRGASAGMVADTDLVLAANRAMVLGVADSSDEMAKLLEIASVRGRQFGMSTADAFNDLVTGIGRMSPMILDNLGITLDAERAFSSYAAGLGKTAAALSDTERKQALLNEVMKTTDTSGGVVVSQFEKMNASIQNAKEALGELFGPATAAIAQQIADATNKATDALREQAVITAHNDISSFSADLVEQATAFQKTSLLMQNALALQGPDSDEFNLWRMNLDTISAGLVDLAQKHNAAAAVTHAPLIDVEQVKKGELAYTEASLGLNNLTTATNESAQASIMAGYATAGFVSGLSQVQVKAGATMGVIYNLTDAVNQLNASTGAMRANSDILGGMMGGIDSLTSGLVDNLGIDGALAKGDELKTQYREQIELLREQGYTTDEIRIILQANVSETQRWASSLDQVGTATSGIEDALKDLQGRALSEVQNATKLDVGLNPEDFLPREDAVNENARRLASIMRDGLTNQPWLEEFKNEVPGVFAELANSGDPQTAAAHIMQQFQDGLRPELLDLNAIKEKIKNDLAGEAAMKATAAEITASLVADTGGDAADIQAKVAKALGLGTEQADVTGGILGNLNSATFNAQLVTAATGAGKAYGNQFLNIFGGNVPAEVIGILANLVTPAVQSNLNQTQSQTAPAGSIWDLHH